MNLQFASRLSRKILLILIVWVGWGVVAEGRTEDDDERDRATSLERALVNLYFYPINRLLDLTDILHFGIAGALGLGGEVAVTEKASFGGYYTAKELGIAYHGHRKRLSWLDAPGGPVSPVRLIPGLDEKQRVHKVEHGYATASFGKYRYETGSEDEYQHFKRYNRKSVINEFIPTEYELDDNRDIFMNRIDESLNKANESAIRAEVVAGIVHPYVALEMYELLDLVTGLFFVDPKKDDWQTEPGTNKVRKLGRGIANVATGIFEIPINIFQVDKNEGGFAAVTYGTARGTWRFLVRSAFVGPWEIVTFPMNTEPVIEPEFPFAATTSDVSWRVKYK